MGQASPKRGSWIRLRDRPMHEGEEVSLRAMDDPKRKHGGTEEECWETEGNEKKMRVFEGTQALVTMKSINQVSAGIAGQPRQDQ